MDRIRNRVAAALICCLALPGAALAKDVFDAKPLGDWRLAAINSDKDKSFSYCATENRYSNGMVIAFARNPDGEVNLAIGFPWDKTRKDAPPPLNPGDRTPLKIQMDANDPRMLVGLSVAPDLLLVPLGKDETFYQSIRKGSNLVLEGPTNTLKLAMTGSGGALAKLSDCVARKGAGMDVKVTAQPVAVPPPPGPIPTALEAILEKANLGKVVPVQLGGDPRTRMIDYAWKVGTLTGGAKEMRRPDGAQFTEMLAGYLKLLEGRCGPGFTSELNRPETVGPLEMATGTVHCKNDKTDKVAAILFFASDQLFTVMFHESAPDQVAYAGEARNRVAAVIRQIAGNMGKDGGRPSPTDGPP